MEEIRYIHAADLHLDAPFQGISRELSQGGRLARLLQEATFTALHRLVLLCENQRPDFLILAGDIYNHENYSIKAQLTLRDATERLGQSGVAVFIAHGNHDPLDSRLTSVAWPQNVTIFGPEVERHPLEKDGETLAVIHGISHAKGREGRNLARLFSRDTAHECFQLGVLHCTVDGSAKADRYAPCSLDDLRDAGLDAWALGHVHEKGTLVEVPFVAYSGNTQGLHINEPGARGCLAVSVACEGTGFCCTPTFHTLGPVAWESVAIDLSGLTQVNAAEERIESMLEEVANGADPSCEAVIARIVLNGATTLNRLLSDPANRQGMLERFDHLRNGSPGVWIKDLKNRTRPPIDLAGYRKRQDLLGCTLGIINDMRGNEAALQSVVRPALKPLFGHGRLRRLLDHPNTNDLAVLLDEAEDLCIDLMEDSDVR